MHVANTRRPRQNPDRHLSVVPDPQPGLWDQGEFDRLAQLRRLAVDTGAPAEALRIIERSATASEAVERLTTAGLMPTEEESLEELTAWFSPLLEPGCDQLQAEVAGSEFMAELRRAGATGAKLTDVLSGLVEQLEEFGRPEALAALRALAAVAPAQVGQLAAEAANALIAGGHAEMPWAADLGSPKPGRCFGYEDVYGEQRSLVATFSYGRKKHALVVLIDYLLGGGIKDCYVADYTESLRNEYRRVARDPELLFSDLDGARARALLTEALGREPCPVEPDQIEDLANYIDLLRARVALLPETSADVAGSAAPAAASAARKPTGGKRPAIPKNIHRLKVALHGTKPPIWRRFEVPSDFSLQRLHTVIQVGFGWENSHLFVFETPTGRYGVPDPDLDFRSAANKKLSAVADWPGDRIQYEYDFGDCWDHDIVVEAVCPAEPGVAYPRCTGGRRLGPPEDCGGVWGYYEMLNTLADPRREDHQQRLWWLGIESADEYDPEHFNLAEVNEKLSKIAKILIKP